MNTPEVLDLIDILKKTGYKHIDVFHEGSHIVLSNAEIIPSNTMIEKNGNGQTPIVCENTSVPEEAIERENIDKSNETSGAIDENKGCCVMSPIVGTYYNAPSPDQEPYVQVGTIVKKGDVLCIIEAMKLMNEIEAEQDGKIVEVLVENEQGVEYGQPLFRIV